MSLLPNPCLEVNLQNSFQNNLNWTRTSVNHWQLGETDHSTPLGHGYGNNCAQNDPRNPGQWFFVLTVNKSRLSSWTLSKKRHLTILILHWMTSHWLLKSNRLFIYYFSLNCFLLICMFVCVCVCYESKNLASWEGWQFSFVCILFQTIIKRIETVTGVQFL